MSQFIKCLVLDDEPPAVQVLSSFIKRIPFLQLEEATTNAFHALELLQKENIDLLFIDIEMPDLTGIQLLKSLEKRPMVVFTTAYEQYAMQGFELDVVDYLLKPIPFERFLRAANKALKLYQSNHPKPIQETHLSVKADYKTIKIAFDDILYIEGLKDYVKIHTKTARILTRLNLKGIEEKLPPQQFIRIHRSFIAALSKITAFQKSQLSIGNKVLPIGETFREKVMKRI